MYQIESPSATLSQFPAGRPEIPTAADTERLAKMAIAQRFGVSVQATGLLAALTRLSCAEGIFRARRRDCAQQSAVAALDGLQSDRRGLRSMSVPYVTLGGRHRQTRKSSVAPWQVASGAVRRQAYAQARQVRAGTTGPRPS